MWPWEHVAFGYLLYSLGTRLVEREPPAERDVLVVVAATQLPDLIDKPLSWGVHLFPSGYAVGHSVFVAVPVGLLAAKVADRYGERTAGIALLVGYWSHLLGDVLSPLRTGGSLSFRRLLWPVVEAHPYATDLGLGRALVYLSRLPTHLSTIGSVDVALFYVSLPLFTVVLWLADGAPGVALLVDGARRVADRRP